MPAIVDQPLPTLKRQPLKKRHTKPCKFYQANACPQSAEECDFLHIPADAMPQIWTPMQQPYAPGAVGPCRYYASTGHCSNSQWYRHQHSTDSSEQGSRNSRSGKLEERSHSESVAGDRPNKDANAPTAVFVPLPGKRHTYGVYGVASNTTGYPTYVEAYHYPHHPAQTYHQSSNSGLKLEDQQVMSPTCATPLLEHSPESPKSMAVTEDPRYEEHTHSHQSKVYVCDDTTIVRVSPPVYPSISPTPIIPVYPVILQHSVQMPPTPASSQSEDAIQGARPRQKSKSRSGSRLRNISYKTKPCRYYIANGYCASGGQCTFIHGEASPNLSLLILNSAAEAAKSKETAKGSTAPATSSNESDKDIKSQSAVTWRVIGGGVLMGDPSRCRSPSTTSSEGPLTPLTVFDNVTNDDRASKLPTALLHDLNLEDSGNSVKFPRAEHDVMNNDDDDHHRESGKQEQYGSGQVTPTGRTRAISNPQSPRSAGALKYDMACLG